jgi:Fe-S-cluster-containing dehydrogenase component
MQFNSLKGVAEKCHFCHHRLDRGERPACVDMCLGRCIHFGEVKDFLPQWADRHWPSAKE